MTLIVVCIAVFVHVDGQKEYSYKYDIENKFSENFMPKFVFLALEFHGFQLIAS